MNYIMKQMWYIVYYSVHMSNLYNRHVSFNEASQLYSKYCAVRYSNNHKGDCNA